MFYAKVTCKVLWHLNKVVIMLALSLKPQIWLFHVVACHADYRKHTAVSRKVVQQKTLGTFRFWDENENKYEFWLFVF